MGMANSFIWRVRTEKVGSLEPFKSEYDMEAFLMNNPALIGCWDPNDETRPPCLLRQQLSTRKAAASGRIDLLGLVAGEDKPTLKIFELKVGAISPESVKQLADYLNGWDTQDSAQKTVRGWLLEVGLQPSIVEKLLARPTGVLVGASFTPEAIAEASRLGIEGIRLARFRSESESEYFVIIEDQIGKIVESARMLCSWSDDGIAPRDRLYLEIRNDKASSQKIFASPDPGSLDRKTKKLIFDKEAVRLLLKHEDHILTRSGKYSAWVKDELQRLKATLSSPVAIAITHATALAFFAFDDERKSWFTPAAWWVLERTNQTISEIERALKPG